MTAKGHGHVHGPTAAGAHRGRLVAVLVVTLAVMLAEVVGGVLSGSFALVADAGHMLTDAGGLALALVATGLAARPATAARTYGWQRAEVLAALVNGMLVAVVGVVVLVEDDPPDDEPDMLGLYEGTPLTERTAAWFGSLPARSTVFRNPTLAACRDRAEVVEEVAVTVVHEVAHHFGIDDERLEELGGD